MIDMEHILIDSNDDYYVAISEGWLAAHRASFLLRQPRVDAVSIVFVAALQRFDPLARGEILHADKT